MDLKHLAAAAILLAPTAAIAQTPALVSQLYVVGTVGYADSNIDAGSINQQIEALGYRGANTTTSEGEFGWRVGGGWQVHPNFALEVSYFDLGRPEFSTTFTRPGVLDAEIKVTGWSIDLVPQYQFNDNWGILGRIGYARSESKASFNGSGAFSLLQTSSKQTNNGLDVGLGFSYALNRNFGVRAEWTYYPDLGGDTTGGSFDANLLSVAVLWRF